MRIGISITVLLASGAMAQEQAAEPATSETDDAVEQVAAAAPAGPRTMSGMSILGNEEAPKSLVIVPWKSSQLGDGLGISNALDQSPRAVDKEVFMRELHFHDLRSGSGE
jgi:hypothetical protein